MDKSLLITIKKYLVSLTQLRDNRRMIIVERCQLQVINIDRFSEKLLRNEGSARIYEDRSNK